jgi:hypothetical protein
MQDRIPVIQIMEAPERPFIITATIDPDDLAPFTRLRDRFFPAERNYLAAHLTLFHSIPFAYGDDFMAAAKRVSETVQPVAAEVGEPINLGRGVAYPVRANQLFELRGQLRDRFAPHLSRQDAAPWRRPHLTVQNKVDPQEARRLLRHLQRHYEPCTIRIIGISRYRYAGGPWTFVDQIRWHPRSVAQTLSDPPG